MYGLGWSEVACVPDGSATAKAINHSLNHWASVTHHLLDGEMSIDNNSVEMLYGLGPWNARPS